MRAVFLCLSALVYAPVPFLSAQERAEAPDLSVRSRIAADAPIVDRERMVETASSETTARRAINVAGIRGSLADWDITDIKGNDVSRELVPQLEGARLSVSSDAVSQFVIKPKTVQRIPMPQSGRIDLPGGIATPSAAPGAGADALEWLRLTFFASPLPAAWSDDDEAYSTTVTFGLRRSSDGSGNENLDEPVRVRMSYDGLTGEDPPTLEIGGVGLEKEKSFTLRFRPTQPEPLLRVRSSISDVDLELRALPRLALFASQSEALGFGLETVTFTVTKLLPYGERARNEAALPVSVNVEGRARLASPPPEFPAGPARADFKVRSAGLGPLKVRASLGALEANAVVWQRFPFGPLIAVALGGALGGYARRFVKGVGVRKTARWVVEGIVVGLIAFVAGVLGVGYLNLPAQIVATEAGAFLTGGLCGFVGVAVLEKLSASMAKGAA